LSHVHDAVQRSYLIPAAILGVGPAVNREPDHAPGAYSVPASTQ
jgi:hypothetical protein